MLQGRQHSEMMQRNALKSCAMSRRGCFNAVKIDARVANWRRVFQEQPYSHEPGGCRCRNSVRLFV